MRRVSAGDRLVHSHTARAIGEGVAGALCDIGCGVIQVVGGRHQAQDVCRHRASHDQRSLRAGHHLPLESPEGYAVRTAVDRDPQGVEVVVVGHARGGRAIIEEVHDAGNRVDAQERTDVLAALVKHVLALGERPTVGADVGAERPHRTAFVDDERALAVGKRVLAAGADAWCEESLVPVEDVDAGRPACHDV